MYANHALVTDPPTYADNYKPLSLLSKNVFFFYRACFKCFPGYIFVIKNVIAFVPPFQKVVTATN